MTAFAQCKGCASPVCIVRERCLFGQIARPAENSADDGAPTRHTLSAPAEPKPEPQDEAIGGLVERLNGDVCRLDRLAVAGEDFIWRPAASARTTMIEAASALSRLQVERDNWRMEYLEAVRGEQAAWAETEKLKQQLTSSQSQPCSETGPNSPSSPQTPFSDGGGEP